MLENPYAPPETSTHTSRATAETSGVAAMSVGKWYFPYLVLTLLALLHVGFSTPMDGSGPGRLFLIVLSFFLHALLVVWLRGFSRLALIGANAAFLLLASFDEFSYSHFDVLNFLLHAIPASVLFYWHYREVNRVKLLMGSTNAIEELESEIQKKGESTLRLNALGVAYGQKEQFAEGIRILRRCLELYESNVAAQINLAWILSKSGNSADADVLYEQLLQKPFDITSIAVLKSNYCDHLARNHRTSECQTRLAELESSLSSGKKISAANRAQLLNAIQHTRTLLDAETGSSPGTSV